MSERPYERLRGEEGEPLERANERDTPVLRRRLTPRQEERIQKLIHKHFPDELGMPHALWSKSAVHDLLAERLELRLPSTTLGAYLKRWGFVTAKVLRKAYDQRPSTIRLWVKHKYPLIAAQARAQRGEIHWIDEANLGHDIINGASPMSIAEGIVADEHPRRTASIMLSIMPNRGPAHWMVHHGPVEPRTLLALLQRSIEGRERKLFLIAPWSPLIQSRTIVGWLAENAERIELFTLPAPDEGPINQRSSGHDDPRPTNELIGA